MTKLLKLGLIVDCNNLAEQGSHELIQWLEANPDIALQKYFLKNFSPQQKRLASYFWSFITYLESVFYRRYFDDYLNKPLNLDDFILLDAEVLNSSDFIHSNQFDSLQSDQIDLFFMLSFDERMQNLCSASQHGILSIHSLLSVDSRNLYPQALYEVLFKSNKTGFSLLHQKSVNASIDKVFNAAFPTHNYFLANKRNLLKRRNIYIQHNLSFFIENCFFRNNFGHFPLLFRLPDTPNLTQQMRYFSAIVYRFSIKAFKNILFKQPQWSVGFYFDHWKKFKFEEAQVIENPINCYLADPFTISNSSKNYCFVEEYSFKTSKGCISVYEINPTKAVHLGYAIEEPFHMSFPYLFTFEGKTYMLPETSANNDIRIYESVEFPLKWRLKKILMKDIFAVDSMILFHDNLWWLLTNINPDNGTDACSDFCIFYSNHPFSDTWHEHKLNPLIVDSELARNGGLLFDKDSIFRVSQKQKFDQYGGEFQISRINVMNEDEYSESIEHSFEPIKILQSKAAHHFHSNGKITAFDFLK